jgi:hypothetical protein
MKRFLADNLFRAVLIFLPVKFAGIIFGGTGAIAVLCLALAICTDPYRSARPSVDKE